MKVAIIGGGASGLSCAVTVGQLCKKHNLKVDITVFEKNTRVGKKLLATGNGRCNMMNVNEGSFFFDKDGFSSYALKRFDTKSNLTFFKELGLYTRYDEEGRIYPLSNQSSSVLDALRFECERLKINFVCDCEVLSVEPHKGGFKLNGGSFYDAVVLSCGGKAAVKSFNGYGILKSLGHSVTKLTASLTKISVKEKAFLKPLKGVRQKGNFSLILNGKLIAEEKGEMQFTDYGLSGIAIMQFSSHIAHLENPQNIEIVCDFVPEFSEIEIFKAIKSYISHNPYNKTENLLGGFVNKKLGESILKSNGVAFDKRVKALNDDTLKNLCHCLKKCKFTFDELKGFDDAQVTCGGADTREFSYRTMMSEKHRNLYCTGELLDVDGLCGGYNLHWAWSSGRLAGESIINEILNRKG
ncbi:MAG: aminoacetone oxidase family FAD-binding enzyme [Acutalibacteraceae bacterium]